MGNPRPQKLKRHVTVTHHIPYKWPKFVQTPEGTDIGFIKHDKWKVSSNFTCACTGGGYHQYFMVRVSETEHPRCRQQPRVSLESAASEIALIKQE